MKYKSKIYARALVDVLSDKKILAHEKKIVDNFLNILRKNRDIHKIKEIIFLAENLLFKKTGKRKIVLETARKIGKKNILESFLKDGDFLEEKIDVEIIAGIKIVINNNRQLDFSLEKKLQEIF